MKITRIQRKELEQRLLNGERQGPLAKEYGVSQTWVCRIAGRIGAAHNAKFTNKARAARSREFIEARLRLDESCNSIARRLKVSPHYIYPIKKARARQSEVRA